MIYLAESGSTKCDAVILDNEGQEISRFKHMGFNPYFHSSQLISRELSMVREVNLYADKITAVYFYGAGCSSQSLNAIVEEGLASVFKNAKISVDHDLLACVYSTLEEEGPCVSCILGTGSNSVYYDGKKVNEEVPALGYVLGDEGSASQIGKKLISNFLYKTMPLDLSEDFAKTFDSTKDTIISNVYSRPNANVYLGRFAPFADKHKNNPFVKDLVYQGFKEFIDIHVLCYKNIHNLPIHFVGSIAYHFRDLLKSALCDANLKLGKIVQKPIDGLIQYHIKHIFTNSSSLK